MVFINSILEILYSISLVNKYLVYHFLQNISIFLLDFSIKMNDIILKSIIASTNKYFH